MGLFKCGYLLTLYFSLHVIGPLAILGPPPSGGVAGGAIRPQDRVRDPLVRLGRAPVGLIGPTGPWARELPRSWGRSRPRPGPPGILFEIWGCPGPVPKDRRGAQGGPGSRPGVGSGLEKRAELVGRPFESEDWSGES